MIGKTILHYKMTEKLGEGGMGIVYLAEDTKLKRKVAIKFLPQYISANEEERKRFEIEAQAAALLNHPNIATIHAIEECGDEIFIVMEYIEGQELKEIVQANRKTHIPIAEIINYAYQISEGLKAAHEKGIVHRDIKSSNIMITSKGQVKITDFGLAKIKGSTELTKEGTTIGTLAYMSPEQLKGGKTDKQTDIWSFGIVLYEMLTGKLPFEREYDQAIIYSILNEDFELNTEDKDVVKMLEPILKKSLSKDKNYRYLNVDDIITDLTRMSKNIEYMESGNSKPSETIPAIEKKKIKFSNKFKKIIISAIIAGLGSAVILFLNPFKSHQVVNPATVNSSNSLAVMYFENIPEPKDETHTGDMITNLLITALSQTKGMEVISRDQLYRVLEEMGLSDNKIITHKTAIKVAQYANVSTILVGSIVQIEPSLAVTTQLIDVHSGKILGSQRLVGYKSEQIFTFVDSLTFLVKKDLGITEDESSIIKSVAQVTTNSPEAYRAYVEGLNLADKLYHKEATIAFKKAIELDSTFAMAYYYLWNVDSYWAESWNFLQKAVKLANNTTERERLLILAMKYFWQNNFSKAAELYKQIIEKYPHETEAYEQLARIQGQGKDLKLFLRGVKTNASSKMLWNNLAIDYALNNQKQKALDAVNRYIQLSPAEPNPYDTKGEIYALFTEYDSSTIFYKKALEFRKDFWTTAKKLGVYYVIQGKYKQAQKYFDMSSVSPLRYPSINIHRGLLNSEIKRLTAVLKSNIPQEEELSPFVTLFHLYYETGQFKKMLQITKEGINEWKKKYKNGTYGRHWLAWALTKNGQSKKAEKIMDDMVENSNKSRPYVRIVGLFALATISFEKGEYEPALKKFNTAFSQLAPNHEPNIFYAICLLKVGHIQKAVIQLNRIKNWPLNDQSYQQPIVPGGKYYAYISNVKSHYWLGVAYEKLGEKENAIKEYKTFLNTWKDADFDSPELKDAKARLQKLGS